MVKRALRSRLFLRLYVRFVLSALAAVLCGSIVAHFRADVAEGALVAMAVAVVLGFWFSQLIVAPIGALSADLRRLGLGDFAPLSAPIKRSDELGDLARAFDEMRVNLRATMSELE